MILVKTQVWLLLGLLIAPAVAAQDPPPEAVPTGEPEALQPSETPQPPATPTDQPEQSTPPLANGSDPQPSAQPTQPQPPASPEAPQPPEVPLGADPGRTPSDAPPPEPAPSSSEAPAPAPSRPNSHPVAPPRTSGINPPGSPQPGATDVSVKRLEEALGLPEDFVGPIPPLDFVHASASDGLQAAGRLAIEAPEPVCIQAPEKSLPQRSVETEAGSGGSAFGEPGAASSVDDGSGVPGSFEAPLLGDPGVSAPVLVFSAAAFGLMLGLSRSGLFQRLLRVPGRQGPEPAIGPAASPTVATLNRARLTKNPNDAAAHFELGVLWLRGARRANALGHLYRAFRLDASLVLRILTDPTLVPVREDPDVRGLLKEYYREQQRKVWAGYA